MFEEWDCRRAAKLGPLKIQKGDVHWDGQGKAALGESTAAMVGICFNA